MLNIDFEKPTYIHTCYSSREERRKNEKRDSQLFEDMCNRFQKFINKGGDKNAR